MGQCYSAGAVAQRHSSGARAVSSEGRSESSSTSSSTGPIRAPQEQSSEEAAGTQVELQALPEPGRSPSTNLDVLLSACGSDHGHQRSLKSSSDGWPTLTASSLTRLSSRRAPSAEWSRAVTRLRYNTQSAPYLGMPDTARFRLGWYLTLCLSTLLLTSTRPFPLPLAQPGAARRSAAGRVQHDADRERVAWLGGVQRPVALRPRGHPPGQLHRL